MKQLVIIGASGHGKVVADLAVHCGYTDIAFLDDARSGGTCLGYPIVGAVRDAVLYHQSDFIVAIGNAETRERVQTMLLQKGLHMATLIHPKAVIASHVSIGAGSVIMAGTVINPDTKIGEGCIINTCASVDHDNVIGDYVHVSVGSHLAGTVHVGKGTWVGAGATVSNNIQICGGCMIGAGAVVVHDIMQAGTYIGVPAKGTDIE